MVHIIRNFLKASSFLKIPYSLVQYFHVLTRVYEYPQIFKYFFSSTYTLLETPTQSHNSTPEAMLNFRGE